MREECDYYNFTWLAVTSTFAIAASLVSDKTCDAGFPLVKKPTTTLHFVLF